MEKTIGVLINLYFIAHIIMIVFSPLAVIWAINHLVTSLFITATPISYGFWSWLAVVVINITWMRKNNLKLK